MCIKCEEKDKPINLKFAVMVKYKAQVFYLIRCY